MATQKRCSVGVSVSKKNMMSFDFGQFAVVIALKTTDVRIYIHLREDYRVEFMGKICYKISENEVNYVFIKYNAFCRIKNACFSIMKDGAIESCVRLLALLARNFPAYMSNFNYSG